MLLLLIDQWKTFDAAVGDFTILADRLEKVEFTQPYIESGLSMIVPEKAEQKAWMFMKPLTWQMWAVTSAILVYTILIVWCLEGQSNPEFSGPLKNQIGTATWFTFTSLFFSQSKY
jgi:ABC-type amino acid transport substrate-binding protein